jgi:hypothetical protein
MTNLPRISLVLYFFIPFLLGASCQHRNEQVHNYYQVHDLIRDGLVAIDEVVASRLMDEAERNIVEIYASGLREDEAMDEFENRMETWFRIDEFLQISRSILTDLDELYETRPANFENLVVIKYRLLYQCSYDIYNFLDEIELDSPPQFTVALRELCNLLDCSQRIE